MSIASVSHTQVFGIKHDIRDNLFSLDEETILYPAGSNVIIANKANKRFIPIGEKSNAITAISVSPDKHHFAIAETGLNAAINVYDAASARKRKSLAPYSETCLAHEFTSMAFSNDSKYLLAQLCQPEWMLHYYAWDKGKLMATIQTAAPNQRIIQVSVSPLDGSLVLVLGDHFVKLYRYAEGELRSVNLMESLSHNYRSHVWLADNRIALGTEDGKILIVSAGKTLQIFDTDSNPTHSNLIPNPSYLTSIEDLIAIKNGFISASKSGLICIYKRGEFDASDAFDYSLQQKSTVPDGLIRTITVTLSEGTLLVELETNQIFKMSLLPPAHSRKADDVVFEAMSLPFHHGQIIGLDICCRKPLIVTCSTDKSIRLWNYLTYGCDLFKYFPEEAFSVALHPSGLYLLVGFSDKLKLLNVLMDDFRVFKEFGIRGCRECRFSNGGQLFAAAHGNMIQIYNTWTFECTGTLKGHNGKIKSLHWSSDDSALISAGIDGAIYVWNIRDLKRENEYILKSCGFTSAICSPIDKIVYAVGSDRMIKEITESQVTCEFDGGVISTQIVMSHSGRMLFVGTSLGCIRSIKIPFSADCDNYQEHSAHSSAVTKLRISFDDQYLFSASEDGCVYVFKVSEKEERGVKRERMNLFADEILITKSDLEEKNVLMYELQRNFDELKLEHEYQLRLKDMSFTEKLKEVTELYSQEIEGLKITTSVLRTEKDREEVKHEEEILLCKANYGQELHTVESKYNTQLMEEFDKSQESQAVMSSQQEIWVQEVKDFEISAQSILAVTQIEYEKRLKLKTADISHLQDELSLDSKECAEILRQTEEDLDTEISNLMSKYEKKFQIEKEECARLKGENGIMRKKFNTLNKDIEDKDGDIHRMKDDEKKLQVIILTLESEITVLKKEMAERDEVIQDKERSVYDLKKDNQELEKFKYVYDHNIKTLKQQVEPREQHILEMTNHIQSINEELHVLGKSKGCHEEKILRLSRLLVEMKKEYTKRHQKKQDLAHYIKSFKVDFQELMIYIQEPALLKKATENLVKKYCPDRSSFEIDLMDSEVEAEIMRQQQSLKGDIQLHRAMNEKEIRSHRMDEISTMAENQRLLKEIDGLRAIKRRLKPCPTARLLPEVNASTAGTVSVRLVGVKKKDNFTRATNVRDIPLPLPTVTAFAKALTGVSI